MIHSRITSKSQTTIPRAVRAALGLKPGDWVGYEVENGEVKLVKINPHDPFENPFALFTEWADELDCEAFDNL